MQPTSPDAGLPGWQRASPSPRAPRSAWLWCLICERAFERMPGAELQPCPYEDCRGHSGYYAWDWNRTRKVNPRHPQEPQPGARYPLLG